MGYIQHEKVDLWEQSPDWWHQLGKAQIVIGWFAHEVLSRKLHVSMLEELVKKGAIVLLACPVAGLVF